MYLIIAMFRVGITPKADAGLAPSVLIAMSQTDRAADLERFRKSLR